MGFAGLAYVHLHLAQGMLDETSVLLAEIPEILEANSITGEGPAPGSRGGPPVRVISPDALSRQCYR